MRLRKKVFIIYFYVVVAVVRFGSQTDESRIKIEGTQFMRQISARRNQGSVHADGTQNPTFIYG